MLTEKKTVSDKRFLLSVFSVSQKKFIIRGVAEDSPSTPQLLCFIKSFGDAKKQENIIVKKTLTLSVHRSIKVEPNKITKNKPKKWRSRNCPIPTGPDTTGGVHSL